MGRRQVYANATERQRAHRQRQRAAGLQGPDAGFERLAALQEEAAQMHVVVRGRSLHLERQATAEQRQLQAELKERDMLDALWTLQTLIADFGYDDVYTHVLQHILPT